MVSGPFVVRASMPAPSQRSPFSEILSGPLLLRARTEPARSRSERGPLRVSTSRSPRTPETVTGPFLVSTLRLERRGMEETKEADQDAPSRSAGLWSKW